MRLILWVHYKKIASDKRIALDFEGDLFSELVDDLTIDAPPLLTVVDYCKQRTMNHLD